MDAGHSIFSYTSFFIRVRLHIHRNTEEEVKFCADYQTSPHSSSYFSLMLIIFCTSEAHLFSLALVHFANPCFRPILFTMFASVTTNRNLFLSSYLFCLFLFHPHPIFSFVYISNRLFHGFRYNFVLMLISTHFCLIADNKKRSKSI